MTDEQSGNAEIVDLTTQQKGDLEIYLVRRRSHLQTFLAVIITMGMFALIGLLLFHGVPSSVEDIVDILIGNLSGAFLTIVAFYFQSLAQRQQTAKNGTTAPQPAPTATPAK